MTDTDRQQFEIRPAGVSDAEIVGTFVSLLLTELYPDQAAAYGADGLIPTARQMLANSRTTFGFLAVDRSGQAAAVLMLNECEAIYAFGRFGEISEMYVDPKHRSAGLGARLVATAVDFARARNWSMIEVGAPDTPRWRKTVDFYARNGFREVGPRLYLPLT